MDRLLVLVRHGQSEWNQKNLFTGWHDVDLTLRGVSEAERARQLLTETKYTFSVPFTWAHKRAQRTSDHTAPDLGPFSAVLLLRPYNELLPESQALIANASVPQEQLDAIVGTAKIYVDPRYGRWDPDSGSVVTLTS